MPTENTDRNLLFGVLALQADFLDATQFAEACSAWAGRKDTPLADLLVERGLLTAQQRGLVDLLLRQKLNKHGGDAHASLAAVATPNVRSVLESVADDDVQQSLAGLHESALPVQPATTAYEPDARQRYTLTRLHARGGIGQVWLAHDEDLGRDVALKELRPDRGDSPAATARFLEEAKVTGQLEHPGIVPVYELVKPRNGQPCYAMRFVGGRTLADAIKDYHRRRREGGVGPLDLRQLLTAFVAVCNAVAYAHSRGVLHRDLKPHNVALGDFGEVLVLDWGLAKVVGQPEGPTSLLPVSVDQMDSRDQTRQGQVLGTPAYMAPEQAEGRLDLMDQRSDVYGLGAVLYEVLTGEPPFGGTNSLEVLKWVVQEPPVPPRQRVSATPLALQAVCLKALAKERQERYGSARELAREVERFLADEPVTAFREPWRVRLGRWARHHRPLVAAIVALLLTATVALAVSTALIRKEELAALAAKEQAERERDRADGNFRLAKEAVEQTVTRVAADERLKQGDFHGLRKALLASAVPFYERFVLQGSDDPGLEAERGMAYRRLAWVRQEMGELEAARADYEQALAIFTRLAEENPSARAPRLQMGWTYNDLGLVLNSSGELKRAEAVYRAGLREYQQLADQDSTAVEIRYGQAQTRENLGTVLARQGERREAEREYRAALKELRRLSEENPDNPNYLDGLAGTYNNLGQVRKDLGQWVDAEDALRSALKTLEHLAGRYHAVPRYRRTKATIHGNLGLLLADIGQRSAAESEYRASLHERQRLVDEHPAVPGYRNELGSSHDWLGLLLKDLGKPVEAEAQFRTALKEHQRLIENYPDLSEYRYGLASAHTSLGVLLSDLGDPARAEAEFRTALKEFQALVQKNPSNSGHRYGLALCQSNRGRVLTKLGRWPEAEAAYRAALEEQQRLIAKYPDMPGYRKALASSRASLGELLGRRGKPVEAERELRAALKERERLATDSPLPAYRQELSDSHSLLGVFLFDQGRQAESEEEHRASLKELRRLVDEHPSVPQYRFNLAVDHNNLGSSLHVRNRRAAAEVEYRAALKELRWLTEHVPSAPAYQSLRGLCHTNLGELLLPDATRRAEAEAELQQAADILGKLVTAHPKVLQYREDLGLVDYNYACLEAIRTRESKGNVPLQEQHAAKAMAWLHKAKEHGAFTKPFYRQDIEKNADLDVLRKRPDFQKLLAELKKPG